MTAPAPRRLHHRPLHAVAQRLTTLAVAAALATALSACGGGDGASAGSGDNVPALAIVTQPLDSQVTAGSTAQFSVGTTGQGQTYQWQRSADGGQTWQDIAGATAATLQLASVGLSDNGQLIRAVARQGGTSLPSIAARLTVTAAVVAPTISVAAINVTATAGMDASFTITATGTSLSYQWQRSSNGSDWSDIAGQTQPTLTLTAVALDSDGTQLRVVVKNSAGSITSAVARLSVQAASAMPSIGSQPVAVSVVAPDAATFSVTASGQPAPSYQWQRSTDGGASYADIAGATAASYSTGATSVANNGERLRVKVSNSAGSVVSEAQLLTVTAAQVAPTISQQPQDQSVAAGQSVTLTGAAAGTPTPTLQWQLSLDAGTTWANINGATGGSYSFTTSTTDNGRRYRVVATNSKGSVSSRGALLTVATPSPLVGRNWATAQSLEENVSITQVKQRASAIDDAGRVTVAFIKSDGTKDRIYVTRGQANAANQAPSWSTPLPINGSTSTNGTYLTVTSAPGGDAVALWAGQAPCTADTYLASNALFNCTYYYFSRYRMASDTWDSPEILTDSDVFTGFQTWLNDRGDLVFLGPSWVPGTTSRYLRVQAVFMRTATEQSFRRSVLSTQSPSPLETVQLDMDGAGNLLLGAKVRRSGTADIVAYRGTVATGFGDGILLEDNTDNAELSHVKLGRFGQQVVVWHFLNDMRTYAATSTNAVSNFEAARISDSLPDNNLIVTDEGQAFLHSIGSGIRLAWTARDGWTRSVSPGHTDSFIGQNYDVSRNGLVLVVGNAGAWTAAYDLRASGPAIGPLSPASARYVVGISNGSLGVADKPRVSVSGIGFVDLLNRYVTLPTAASPQGVVHPSSKDGFDTSALWGAFLK